MDATIHARKVIPQFWFFGNSGQQEMQLDRKDVYDAFSKNHKHNFGSSENSTAIKVS